MFLKKTVEKSNTLSFRLSLWYTGLFTLFLLVSLSIIYVMTRNTSLRELDESLQEEIQEMTMMMQSGGIDKVKSYMVMEVQTEDEAIFFRLLDADGRVLAVESNHPWKHLENPAYPVSLTPGGKGAAFETVRMAGYSDRVRFTQGGIGTSEIMQVGKSMADIDRHLFLLRNLMLLICIPLIAVSALIGWRLARHAMRGVEDVTRTAREISGGAYDQRVSVRKRYDEIARLAETFNTMVDRLQAVMKSMGEMTDNIAHDLRSPLARIRGIAEMALMRSSSIEEFERMAVSTIEECDELIRTINTTLDLTELEAGAGNLMMEDVDVIRVVSDACELFGPIASDSDIRIVRHFDDTGVVVRTDKRKLQRLVINLLENAIKYNRPGGSVTISVKAMSDKIRIGFADTGIGISEAELPRIFDRFYRCDRSRSHNGIGLGLSLVRAIVNALEGDISVESTEGKGSRFVVTLPGPA